MTLQRPFKHRLHVWGQGAVCCAALLSLSACDNGCEKNRESYPQISFVSTSGRQLRSVSISLLSEGQLMTGKALDKYENISVKINPQSTRTDIIASCTYSDYGDSFSEIDTVTVLYEVQPRFLDLSCGCTVSYNITQVTSTHHLFGNVVLNNAYVDSETGLNLTIEY